MRQAGAREVEREGGPTKRPPSYDVPWENPRTGKVEKVPVGIDPGWNYHVGKDRMKGLRDAEEL